MFVLFSEKGQSTIAEKEVLQMMITIVTIQHWRPDKGY
jgi:hypothetical protein